MTTRTAMLAALLAAGAALTGQPAFAQAMDSALHAGALEVPVNKSQVVTADRVIAKALIGNPAIADVLPISDRSVYVLGKALGTTSLTLYDRLNRVIAVMDVEVGPDVGGLRTQMSQLMPGQQIEARLSNGSIVLSGMVNSAGAADRAAQLAKAYAGDKVINLISMGGSQQVMLEVRFAEVTRNINRDLGVRSTAGSKDGTFGGVAGTGSQFAPGLTSSSSTRTNNSGNTNSNNNTSTGTTNSNNSNATGSNSGASNSTNLTIGTAPGKIGETAPFSGSSADFTNLGTLAGKTFTGTGTAGSSGSTSSGTTGSSSSGSSSNVVGTIASAIGSTAAGVLSATTSTFSSLLSVGNIGNGFGIFRKSFSIGNVAIESVLNALESRGLAKTLAEPTLIALSGEKASFLAGGEFPIPVAQSSSGGGNGNAITVEFKPFGVSLAFTPTVLDNKVINLVVEPEVSSLDASASVTINGLVIPGLRTRRARTTLELRDGESFAIAGLLQRDFQTTVRQLPLLGSLPILGALFRSSSFQKGETELMIVVTPRLVAPIKPEQVRLPTDRVGDPKAYDLLLDGEGYHPKALVPQPARPAAPAPGPAGAGAPAAGEPPQASAGELPPATPAPAVAANTTSAKDSGYEY